MDKKMLEELTALHGVGGYEKQVTAYISDKLRPLADKLWVDANGNLIVYKKGSSPKAKKVLFCAHMDEIGLQVIKINEDGTVMVKELGFWFMYIAYQARVMFRNGVVGVVDARVDPSKMTKEDFCVDIGVSTKAEAEQLVEVGDVARFLGPVQELAGGNLMASAIDDRVGCYMQIQALLENPQPKNDVYMAFTVQEELGTRGGGVVAHQVRPDVGVAIDVTPSHDRPTGMIGSNALGKGVAIKISDTHSVSDEGLVDTAVALCKAQGIPYQKDVIYRGGTDAGAITLTGDGVKTIGFSVVTRYTHGQNCMVNMADIEATIALTKAYMDVELDFS